MRKVLSNNGAGSKELGLLALLLSVFLAGCITTETVQEKLIRYNCYWDCPNESGENGWCCEHEVPAEDHYIFDCKNANERKIIK